MPRRPKLGNDPFVRGAAERAPAPAKKPAPRRKPTTRAKPAEAPVIPPAPEVAAPAVIASVTGELSTPAMPPAVAPVAEAAGHDPFGREPAFEARSLRALEVFYRKYFRVDARGLEHVPASGPVILVANRAGGLPWDVAMLKCAVALEHPAHRHLRPLADEAMLRLPLLGTGLLKFGAVRAGRESARALLEAGEAVAIFPEGARGADKGFMRRYRLQSFGRGGFVKLALETGAMVVPVAIVGAEEAHPRLTPRLPWLGPLGLWPAPSKWIIEFGAPITPEALSDGNTGFERPAEEVRRALQARVDRLLRTRRGIFR
jgi:1-acyl-sn-glycerol-3-phosphate acyltransferase